MKYALLFPGQGSQSVGMLSSLGLPEIAQTFAEASDVLGWDLARLVREGPAEELNRTEKTQPAMLAGGIAVWRHWRSRGLPAPSALAGHSLGEYSALVAAGSLTFADALKLVELRGQLMQAATPGGMMVVVGMDDPAVDALCAACPDGVLEPANFNAPGQIVVAGEMKALEWLEANGKSKGARMLKRVAMSVPSHSTLLRDAAEKLAETLAKTQLRAPDVPVRHNIDGQARTTPEEIRSALAAQLYRPVRWTQTVQGLHADGITHLFECGPGKVLVGLNKRIADGLTSVALEDRAGLDQAAQLVAQEKSA